MHNLKAIFSGCQHDWRQFFNKFLAFCKVHIIFEKIYRVLHHKPVESRGTFWH